jgi:hypothetical protein
MLDYDSIADLSKEIKALWHTRPNDDFKIGAIQSLQAIEMSDHRNKREAAETLKSCVRCYYRKDVLAARVLLFASGAIINDAILPGLVAMQTSLMSSNAPPPMPNFSSARQ